VPFIQYMPFVNLKQGRLIYRYLSLHLTVAGTTPSITLMSWLSWADQRI